MKTLPVNMDMCLHFISPFQVTDVRVENVNERPTEKNIFNGKNSDKIIGKEYLAALKRPVVLQWTRGKVKTKTLF